MRTKIITWLKTILGLQLNPSQRAFKDQVDKSYSSLRVSERGAISIDADEVRADPSFKEYLSRASNLVNHNQKESQ